MLSGHNTLPNSPHMHQPGSPLTPILGGGVNEAFIRAAWSIESLAIGIGLILQSLSPPQRLGQ